MEKIVEHRVTEKRFQEEHRTVFLNGYYTLLEAEIKQLEESKISDLSNQTTKSK